MYIDNRRARELFDPDELQPRTARFAESHVVARDLRLINRRPGWRFNFYSPTIPKTVASARLADRYRSVAREFPNNIVWLGSGPPFPDNVARWPAASDQDRQQNCAD